MTEQTAYWIVDRIYNTFGRPVPRQTSGQFQTLYDNINQLPDVCAKFIARKATELDNLPSNLSKFFLSCWEEWKTENPDSVYRIACQTCGGAGGWTFFRQDVDTGSWHEFYSPCPACTYLPSRYRDRLRSACKTPRELQAEGCLVMPNGYKGGILRFRLDKGIDKYPDQDATSFADDVRKVQDRMIA